MLSSLNRLLNHLENRVVWREQRQFRQVLLCWAETVGAIVAAQTSPSSISKSVLRVATSSSSWAQNISFQRHLILKKLNNRLEHPLADIRFFAAPLHSEGVKRRSVCSEVRWQQQTQIWQDHPSYMPIPAARLPMAGVGGESDPEKAFQRWLKLMQLRSQDLPICPHCQCPVPPGELQRWAMCAFCAAQTWAKEGESSSSPTLT